MLSRFVFALPLLLVAVPALAADPAPADHPAAGQHLDPLEQAFISQWLAESTARDNVADVLRRAMNERRVLIAQMRATMEKCGDRCQPAPQAQATPADPVKPAAAE